jgi:hypothetical protein
VTTQAELVNQFKMYSYESPVDYHTELTRNLNIGNKVGNGSYNTLYSAVGKNICNMVGTGNLRRNVETIPLVLRTGTCKNKQEAESFKKEMQILVNLSNSGVMPHIYMCGFFDKSDRVKKSFAIMERFTMDVRTLLRDHSTAPSLADLVVGHVCQLYANLYRLAKVSNIDAKPENVVVNFIDGRFDRVALIDIDPVFNLDLEPYSRYYDMKSERLAKIGTAAMQIIFLLIVKHSRIIHIKDIADKYLSKIDDNVYTATIEMVELDNLAFDTFVHYDVWNMAAQRNLSLNKAASKSQSNDHRVAGLWSLGSLPAYRSASASRSNDHRVAGLWSLGSLPAYRSASASRSNDGIPNHDGRTKQHSPNHRLSARRGSLPAYQSKDNSKDRFLSSWIAMLEAFESTKPSSAFKTSRKINRRTPSKVFKSTRKYKA